MVARSEGDANGPEPAIEGHRATIKVHPTSTPPPSPLRNPGFASWVDAYWGTLASPSSYPRLHLPPISQFDPFV